MLIYGAPDPEDRVPEVAQSYTLFTFTVRIESKVWTKNLVGILKKNVRNPFLSFQNQNNVISHIRVLGIFLGV